MATPERCRTRAAAVAGLALSARQTSTPLASGSQTSRMIRSVRPSARRSASPPVAASRTTNPPRSRSNLVVSLRAAASSSTRRRVADGLSGTGELLVAGQDVAALRVGIEGLSLSGSPLSPVGQSAFFEIRFLRGRTLRPLGSISHFSLNFCPLCLPHKGLIGRKNLISEKVYCVRKQLCPHRADRLLLSGLA